MKVCEVIDNYNIERPNDVSDDRKVRYIENLEKLIFNEIVLTHEIDDKTLEYIQSVVKDYNDLNIEVSEDEEEVIELFKKKDNYIDIDTYFKAFSYDTNLMADNIHAEVYMHYIDQKIAASENESKRYNAATTMYNNAYITFQDFWNRTHLPLSKPLSVAHHGCYVKIEDQFPPVV